MVTEVVILYYTVHWSYIRFKLFHRYPRRRCALTRVTDRDVSYTMELVFISIQHAIVE